MKYLFIFSILVSLIIGFLFGRETKDCTDPQIFFDMGLIEGYKKNAQKVYDKGVLAGYDKCFKKGGFIKLEDARPHLEEKAMEVER